MWRDLIKLKTQPAPIHGTSLLTPGIPDSFTTTLLCLVKVYNCFLIRAERVLVSSSSSRKRPPGFWLCLSHSLRYFTLFAVSLAKQKLLHKLAYDYHCGGRVYIKSSELSYWSSLNTMVYQRGKFMGASYSSAQD